MESMITLSSQPVQNRVREIGINPNYWYPVAWAHHLKVAKIISVVVWQQAIAVYRDINGQLHALENACPHKGVALDKGEVNGTHLVCSYHGWEFNGQGKCVRIPYLPPEQKLPCAQARSYPIREKYGIIWVFPGEASLAEHQCVPAVPEYDDPDWIIVQIPTHFQAHFSICNENTIDVFHGFLHRNLQGWFDPILLKLRQEEDTVCAEYRVSYQGWLSKILKFSNDAKQVTTRTIAIEYNYPHYHSTLEGVSSLYIMRLPVSPTETRSFSLLFVKVRLPKWLVNSIRGQLSIIIWYFLFKKFVDQDVEMIESEQQAYLANPKRQYVEINPAIIALQRVNIAQYEKFVQQSQSLTNNKN